MGKKNRDDFSSDTIKLLADRAGHLCSNPHCRRATTGANKTEGKKLNIGIAAHITAAAPKGPRYDSLITAEERASYDNGIWLCSTCATMIDNDRERYSPELLRKWKSEAENFSYERVTFGEKDNVDYLVDKYVDIFNNAIQYYDVLSFLHEDPTGHFSDKYPELIDQFVIEIQENILKPYIHCQRDLKYKTIRDFAYLLDNYNGFLALNMEPGGNGVYVFFERELDIYEKIREEIKKYKLELDELYQKINDGNSIYAF